MASALGIAVVFFSALTFLVTQSDGALPGFKIRITKTGIDYVSEVLLRSLVWREKRWGDNDEEEDKLVEEDDEEEDKLVEEDDEEEDELVEEDDDEEDELVEEDDANTIAHDKLASELKTLNIPNQSGKDGHIEWSFSNVQNRGSTVPTTSMALSPGQNGVTWAMSNLGINLHADWRVKYKKGWVKASTSGSVDMSITGVSLQVTITLGADATGRPTMAMAACNAQISSVKLHFHGGTAFLINLFKGTLERKIRDMMKDQICKIIQKEVNVDGAQALSKLKINVILAKLFRLDYGLLKAPGVQPTYLETEHKGEVYWIGDSTEAPFPPKPFPALTDDTKMMYMWVSEYTVNSMAYAAQKHGFLKYNLTADDLPPGSRDFLNTTCKLKCIGTVIPQNLSMSLNASIVNGKLTGQITDHTFKVEVLKSDVGNVSSAVLNLILGGAMSIVVIPKFNEIAKNGVDLPVTGNIKLINTSINQLDGSILIATDLQPMTSEVSQSLKFRSEVQRW